MRHEHHEVMSSFATLVVLLQLAPGKVLGQLSYDYNRRSSDAFTAPSLLQTETLAPDPNQFQPTTSSSVPVFETNNLAWSPMKGNELTMPFPSSIQSPNSPLLQPPMQPFLPKPPFGTYEVISSPTAVRMTIAAKNVELVCSAFGDFKGPIRWVRLKSRMNNIQEFEVVANGNTSFDPAHYEVKADREMSRLTIRDLDPALHFGTYQCQVSLNGFGSFIQKLDFNVGVRPEDLRMMQK